MNKLGPQVGNSLHQNFNEDLMPHVGNSLHQNFNPHVRNTLYKDLNFYGPFVRRMDTSSA